MIALYKKYPQIKAIGLCHSVQSTAKMIADDLGESIENLDYECVGINHLSFFITDETKKTVKAILFNATDNEIDRIILNSYKKNLFSFVGFVKKSIWKNKSYFEVIIEDGVLGKDII